MAHTVAVGGGEVTGRAADVLLAAHYASEAALRLLRPGNEVRYTRISDRYVAVFFCIFILICIKIQQANLILYQSTIHSVEQTY